MANDGPTLPHIASLRTWERLGFPNRHALREAIRVGALRAFRAGKRTILVTHPDLLRWLERNAVEPEHQGDRQHHHQTDDGRRTQA